MMGMREECEWWFGASDTPCCECERCNDAADGNADAPRWTTERFAGNTAPLSGPQFVVAKETFKDQATIASIDELRELWSAVARGEKKEVHVTTEGAKVTGVAFLGLDQWIPNEATFPLWDGTARPLTFDKMCEGIDANLNWRERRKAHRDAAKAADDHAAHLEAHAQLQETIMQEAQREVAEAQRQIEEARGDEYRFPAHLISPEVRAQRETAAAPSVTYLDGVRVEGAITQKTKTWIEVDGVRRYGRVETVDSEGRVVRDEVERVQSRRRWV